jgi:hypothetical protein
MIDFSAFIIPICAAIVLGVAEPSGPPMTLGNMRRAYIARCIYQDTGEGHYRLNLGPVSVAGCFVSYLSNYSMPPLARELRRLRYRTPFLSSLPLLSHRQPNRFDIFLGRGARIPNARCKPINPRRGDHCRV